MKINSGINDDGRNLERNQAFRQDRVADNIGVPSAVCIEHIPSRIYTDIYVTSSIVLFIDWFSLFLFAILHFSTNGFFHFNCIEAFYIRLVPIPFVHLLAF